MAVAALPTVTRRSASVLAMVGVLLFVGTTAAAGGVALVSGAAAPPIEWLEQVPLVDTWTVPGIVLGAGFGLGSLVAVYGVLRRPRWPWLAPVERLTRHHWSWLATLLIGLGHIAWIALELIYLPESSVLLQAVYGGVGVVLVVLPMTAPVRRYLQADVASR